MTTLPSAGELFRMSTTRRVPAQGAADP